MNRFSKEDPSLIDEVVAHADMLHAQFESDDELSAADHMLDVDSDEAEDENEYYFQQYRVKNVSDKKKVLKFKKHIFRDDE